MFKSVSSTSHDVHLVGSPQVLNHAFRLGTGSADSDHVTILRTAALRNASPHPEIFAELVDPAYKTQLLASGANHVMCAEELKMHVLVQLACVHTWCTPCSTAHISSTPSHQAMNVTCPGFSTLLTNLITSNDPPDETVWMLKQHSSNPDHILAQRQQARLSDSGRSARSARSTRSTVSRSLSQIGRHLSFGKSARHQSDAVVPVTWRQEYEHGAAMEVCTTGRSLPLVTTMTHPLSPRSTACALASGMTM